MPIWSEFRSVPGKWRSFLAHPAIALTGLLSLAYVPLFAGKLIYNRDLSRFVYPIRWFVRDSLARGDRPWWTPHIGIGHSMLADPQAALFYPVNLLHLLGPLPLAVMMVFLLHLVWGAVGMAGLARAFRLGKVGTLTAGITWALSGSVASLWTNGARLPSAAWIPWEALAFVGVARAARERQGTTRAVAWLGLAGAMGLLAGDFFVAAVGLLLGLALASAALLDDLGARGPDGAAPAASAPSRLRVAIRFASMSAGAVALGAMLAAVTVLPAARALEGTERAHGLVAKQAELGSFHPLRMTEFAAPEAFSRAWYRRPNAAWVAAYLDGQPLSLNVYLGGSVLVLVLLAFLPRRNRGQDGTTRDDQAGAIPEPSRRAALMVAAVGLLFLLFAFGYHTPFFGWLRLLAPPFKYMRAPEKLLMAVVPATALLAGWGAHQMLAPLRRPSWKPLLVVPSLVLLLALLAPVALPADLGAEVRGRAWHGLIAASAVALLWPLARTRARLASVLLLGVVSTDLALASGLTLRYTDWSALRPPPIVEDIRPHASPGMPYPRLFRGSKIQLSAAQASGLDSDEVTRQTLRENLGVPFKIAELPGYGVATPPAFTSLLGRGRLDALRLLATDYALLSAVRPDSPVPEDLEVVSERLPGMRLYRLQRTLPRVFVAFKALPTPEPQLTNRLLDADVVSGTTVLLDGEQRLRLESREAQAPTPCALDGFDNIHVRATCDSDQPGLAVFVEQFAKGWSATIDGTPAPVLRADTMLRAVPLPAGKHHVALSFEPPGLHAGAWLSVLGLALTGLLFFAQRLKARWRGFTTERTEDMSP